MKKDFFTESFSLTFFHMKRNDTTETMNGINMKGQDGYEKVP